MQDKIFYEQAENQYGQFLWFRIYKDKKLYEAGQIFEEDGIKYAVISHEFDKFYKEKYGLIKLKIRRSNDKTRNKRSGSEMLAKRKLDVAKIQ